MVGVLLSHKCICSIHLREWEEGRKKESEMRVERERDDHKWTSKGGLELKPLWLLQTSFILLHRQVQYKAEGRGIESFNEQKRFYELTLFLLVFWLFWLHHKSKSTLGEYEVMISTFFFLLHLFNQDFYNNFFLIYLLLCTYISHFISDFDNIWPKFSYCGLKRPYGMSFYAYS